MAGDGIRAWAVIYLKGICMGTADSVPGVSGGTIALIAGIYERLITAIAGLDPRVLKHIPRLHTREGRSALSRDLIEMDVPFLVALGMGVVTALIVMAGFMHWAIDQYPALTASFFFGLIAAAAVVLYRYVSVDTIPRVAAAVIGFGFAFILTGFTGGNSAATSLVIMVGTGAIAISAMILPGISGAFILYMLGQYEYMSKLPGQFIAELVDVASGGDPSLLLSTGTTIAAFGVGAIAGLLTITHAIKYALSNYREATLTFLVSLMVGSLRAPVSDIAANVDKPTPGFIASIVVIAVLGGVLVVALDLFTEDIEFGGDADHSSDTDHESPQTESPINDD
jgi:putative membrane protein